MRDGSTGTGRVVRWVLTDRHGVRADPARPARDDAAAVRGGVSAPPYDALDLAGHVGDDPAAVAANRAVLAGALGVPVERLHVLDQVHGRAVHVVTSAPPPDAVGPRADASVTDVPGVALVVLVADCVPVVLHDEAAGVVGVVHAGRRGVVVGVVPAAVAAARDLGATALSAVVGPAVCAGCYEVPGEMRDAVGRLVPAAVAESSAGTPALDLRAGVRAQLHEAGVDDVVLLDGCTAEDPTLYSYRRDGTTGRFAMAVVLDDRPADAGGAP